MNSVVYEDKPTYDIWMKAILSLPLFFVAAGALYTITSEPEAAIGMFATAILMVGIYWAILPRKYCIFGSKVKIVLGGPFSFTIPFDTIEIASSPEGMAIGINFATSFSAKKPVQIVRKGKLNVNITPGNSELFLENLDKALSNWRNYNTKAQ